MSSWTYGKAGVDLSKHRSMHKYALKLVEDLNRELGYDVEGLGGYTSSITYGGNKLVLHVDGVGTKTIVLQKLGKLRIAGWDCVAMNVNDVVCDNAKPIAVVDYIAMPSADEEVFKEIIEGIVEAAKEARVAVLGGETAILPDLVNGVDVVCTVLAIKEETLINRIEVGDVIVGVSSWGLHANGYSLVRRILEDRGLGYGFQVEDLNLGEELSKPVAIYSNLVLELQGERVAKAVAHITGGAFSKVKRLIHHNIDVMLEIPKPPKIFDVIMRLGNVSVEEMYKVFNMGIGLIIAVNGENLDTVKKIIEKHGFTFYELGKAVEGQGRVVLKTCYGTTVVF
ncbi:MAG: phosphoribosylformylglycinamidine cyclo-ligase [Ignisphaera sp.]|uniref:phosphoribosylformylglycinamidine cyclo-ligase n=1 Tax=Ignisphaera aggregans TaxID=334771 RepID=A0A7C4JJY4_9CREN